MPFATAHGWDVREAIRSHVLDSPYPILPVDVARKWRAHRRDRLDRHTDPTPTADPDDPTAWRAELLRSRNAVAAGLAAPSKHQQITSCGRSRDIEERLREIGSCIPPAVRAELARYRPTRAAREAAGTNGVPDTLSVRCEWVPRTLPVPRAVNGGRTLTAPPGATPYVRLPTRRASISPPPGSSDSALHDAAPASLLSQQRRPTTDRSRTSRTRSTRPSWQPRPGTEPAKLGDRTSVPDGPRDHDHLKAGTVAHGDRIAGTVTTTHRGPRGDRSPREPQLRGRFVPVPRASPGTVIVPSPARSSPPRGPQPCRERDGPRDDLSRGPSR